MDTLGLLLQLALASPVLQEPADVPVHVEDLSFDPSAEQWPLAGVISYAEAQLGIPFHFVLVFRDKMLPRPPQDVDAAAFRVWLEKTLAQEGMRLCSFGPFLSLQPAPAWSSRTLDTAAFVPPEELERYRGLEIVITTVLKAPGAADAEVTRFADRFDPASGWICAVPGQPILWLVGPAEVVRSTVEEIAGPRATGVAGAGDEPERQAANSGRLCVQFDEVEGSPLADFAALATEVLHQPVHVDSGLEDMRLRFLGAFELELGDFRGFLEAVLAVHNVIVIESEDGLTLRRSLPVARDEGTALVVPVERADLAAEQDRWHPIRVSLVLQKADAADVAEMMRSPFMELFVERLQANAASNSVELTGSGFSVWRTVRVLEEIDRLCAEPAGR